jgi:hypothetical protein
VKAYDECKYLEPEEKEACQERNAQVFYLIPDLFINYSPVLIGKKDHIFKLFRYVSICCFIQITNSMSFS